MLNEIDLLTFLTIFVFLASSLGLAALMVWYFGQGLTQREFLEMKYKYQKVFILLSALAIYLLYRITLINNYQTYFGEP